MIRGTTDEQQHDDDNVCSWVRRGRVNLIKIYAIIGGLADKRTNMIDVIEDYDEDDDPSYDEGDADADDFVEDNEIMRAMKILMILG